MIRDTHHMITSPMHLTPLLITLLLFNSLTNILNLSFFSILIINFTTLNKFDYDLFFYAFFANKKKELCRS